MSEVLTEVLIGLQSFLIENWQLIFGGLLGWLAKVQLNRTHEKDKASYTRKLEDENRTLQAQLDKSVHVYRVQFETEFRSLLAVWGKLANVRSAMAGLRPSFEMTSQTENFDERLTRKLKDFTDAINELKTAVHHHSPFYPEDIYNELIDAIDVCDIEKCEVALEGQESERPNDWFKQGEKSFSDLKNRAEIVSSKIRKRIESLSLQG